MGCIVRLLSQCRFCLLSHFQVKSGDDYPLSTTVLSQFHKLLSTPSLRTNTNVPGDKIKHGPPFM